MPNGHFYLSISTCVILRTVCGSQLSLKKEEEKHVEHMNTKETFGL